LQSSKIQTGFGEERIAVTLTNPDLLLKTCMSFGTKLIEVYPTRLKSMRLCKQMNAFNQALLQRNSAAIMSR